jgi:hypothetical protein
MCDLNEHYLQIQILSHSHWGVEACRPRVKPPKPFRSLPVAMMREWAETLRAIDLRVNGLPARIPQVERQKNHSRCQIRIRYASIGIDS